MQSSSANHTFIQKCCDCQDSFTTASALLQHFAYHVCEKNKIDFKSKNNKYQIDCNASWSVQNNPKKRKKAVLGSMFKKSNFYRLSNSNSLLHMPRITFGNSSFIETSVESSNSKSQANLVEEIGMRAKDKFKCGTEISLVKCDFQKRLENCISRLTIKKETTSCLHAESSSDVAEDAQDSSVDTDFTFESDEFSPMKFCKVTMASQERHSKSTNSKLDHIDKWISRTSSRKQLSPKKILQVNTISDKLDEDKNNKPTKTTKSNGCITTTSVKKRYSCNICLKTFGWSTDLKRHILTHTGERPFKCTTCGAAFTRNFLLQKHELRIHQINGIHNRKGALASACDKTISNDDSHPEQTILPVTVKKKGPSKCSDDSSSECLQITSLKEDEFLKWCSQYSSSSQSFKIVSQEALNVV